jgi:hypothetical protein
MGRLACKHLGDLPDFAWEATGRVRESGPQEGKTGSGSGAGRPAPLPLPLFPPVRAHFGPRNCGGLESLEAGTASTGLVKIGNLLIIFDGSPGGSRRRTLGPVPQLQMPQTFRNASGLESCIAMDS